MDNRREPLEFSIGDTLKFCRVFSDFTPANGWELSYQIRQGSGGDPIEFSATPDATNSTFLIDVAPAVTALWQAGPSRLAGFVQNTLASSPHFGDRHNIYLNELTLLPNFNSATDDAPVTTSAQRLIPILEGQLEQLASSIFSTTIVEETTLIRKKMADIQQQLNIAIEKRRNEIALENVRNGKPSGMKILPRMRIVDGQPGIANLYFPAAP